MALVARKARLYDSQMCCDMTTFLYDFGYTSADVELQILLQLMKHHLGDLHLDQLIDLGLRVATMPSDVLTQSLSEGIKVSVTLLYLPVIVHESFVFSS